MKKDCKIALIVAVAENGVIGADNKIPWKCSSDMSYFRKMTMGKPVIMGRKTWDSLGKPLKGRTNIVISKNPDFEARGALRVTSIERALELGLKELKETGAREIMVIGGAGIYRQMLASPLICKIYKTEICLRVRGDSFFPSDEELRGLGFEEISRIFCKAGPKDQADMVFLVLEKVKKS